MISFDKFSFEKLSEQEEKTAQFNMNLAFAAGENKDLVQDISAKNAIIQNMTKLIEQLENQAVSSYFIVTVVKMGFSISIPI